VCWSWDRPSIGQGLSDSSESSGSSESGVSIGRSPEGSGQGGGGIEGRRIKEGAAVGAPRLKSGGRIRLVAERQTVIRPNNAQRSPRQSRKCLRLTSYSSTALLPRLGVPSTSDAYLSSF
jgi:hypothetical protein